MISIEVTGRDLQELAKVEVSNLPGVLYAGTSPLLKPFMKKLEELLPQEQAGRGDAYVLSALHSHIDEVHADEALIEVKGGDKAVQIRRTELHDLLGERYPTTDHHRLNLPGLLFLQSSPTLQAACVVKLRAGHKLRVPDGRRTMRYVFHIAVVSIEANKEKIRVNFDPERLPKKADGSCVLE